MPNLPQDTLAEAESDNPSAQLFIKDSNFGFLLSYGPQLVRLGALAEHYR